jgi:hypothetical protein
MNEKREALDRVLKAALAERTDTISLYDCAMWLLYACTRSDAISTARDLEEDDSGESEWTVKDECEEAIEQVMEGEAPVYDGDIRDLGKLLDPEFEKPARELTDWLSQA